MPDSYTRRARLAPAGLAAMPALVLIGGGLLAPSRMASMVAIAFGAVGLLVCGIVRDAGRKLQDRLWESWGGPPVTMRLRWRDNPAAIVTRLHKRVLDVVGEPLPTPEEEQADPTAADQRYEESILALRAMTRDAKRFPLLFEENVHYGFRRNCLGIRPFALGVAGAVVIVSAILIATSSTPGRFWGSLAAGCVALAGWSLLVTGEWVRRAAEPYADRLIEAVETLRR